MGGFEANKLSSSNPISLKLRINHFFFFFFLFRHANIRAIKLQCPNLQNLTMTMMTKNIFTSEARIEVDKVSSYFET